MTEDGSVRTLRSIVPGPRFDGLLETVGFGTAELESGCSCRCTVTDETLVVEASDCDGTLATATACRRAVIEALIPRDVNRIVVRSNGVEHHYCNAGVALLCAAGRFVERLGDRDARVRTAALADPLEVAEKLSTRVDSIGDIARESGLVAATARVDGFDDVLSPTVGLTIGHYRLDPAIDDDSRLRGVRTLETGSDVRIYARRDGIARYVLDIVDLTLSDDDRRSLIDGYEAIADGVVDGGRAASRALERVTDGPIDPQVTTVLSKHTRGYGVLEDLFADPRLTDVYVTSPVPENPIRVVVDGETMATNVYLTRDGARALASRVRRTSGRAFSRANPTVDATATLENGTGVRVAGVTDPVADGVAFAFREQADDRFTLPALVANGTMSSAVAGFLSIAVERNAAALIAGTRGSGKTTLLGTLLYELPSETRTVAIEDTPELPVRVLQSVGRDVQPLRTGTGDGPEIAPADALRTALRLGDGALVVGEIRGDEANVLYEAMRVGANANAVLGTIHGDGADEVYERVVSDLNVPPTSFGTTDLVVTVQSHRTPTGRTRRLARIEEVIGDDDRIWFESLYELEGDRAVSTGRIDRGESRLVDRIAGPTETYADVRRAIETRSRQVATLAEDGRTTPRDVAVAHANREFESDGG